MIKELSIILLAYNEEKNIAMAIEQSVNIAKKIAQHYEILVVYYVGSTDATEIIVKKYIQANPHIKLIVQHQKGYGTAITLGIKSASMENVFYTDADNQFNLGELEVFVPHLKDYDLILGYRIKRKDPITRIITAKVYNLMLRAYLGIRIRDVDCSFKLIKRNCPVINFISSTQVKLTV